VHKVQAHELKDTHDDNLNTIKHFFNAVVYNVSSRVRVYACVDL
jgi:hypothetical protein